jgi:hypothetical protein
VAIPALARPELIWVEDQLTLGLGLLLLAALLWGVLRFRPKRKPVGGSTEAALPALPQGLSLSPQPLLTRQEAAFYNLLRLAVQDQFLVFAQVPVWCLVEIHAPERRARTAFLNQIALRRVDFVLVHPGSLAVAKVIELDEADHPTAQRQGRARLLDLVLGEAGIELIRLDARAVTSAPALAEKLGLPSEE